MINLQEVFDVTWTFTAAEITARDTDGLYLHRFIFADESYFVTTHQRHDIESEKLTIVIAPINCHGEQTRGGPEIGWGYKKNSIPKELMEAPITRMMMANRFGGRGVEVYIDIECNQMTVEILQKKLADKAMRGYEEQER